LKNTQKALENIPNKGIGYGILRYLATPRTRQKLTQQNTPHISFNYLGQFEKTIPGLGTYADPTEPTGHETSPNAHRSHPLQIIGLVRDGQLEFRFSFTDETELGRTASSLAESFNDVLVDLVVRAREAGPLFPEVGTEPERVVDVSLVDLSETPQVPTVFCFHENGGNVTGYVDLVARLAPHARLIGIESRVVGFGLAAQDNIAEMANDYWQAIRRIQPQGPYALVGWSFGGLIAYEVASQAQAAGAEVRLLCAIDTPLPTEPTKRRITADREAVGRALEKISRFDTQAWEEFVARGDGKALAEGLELTEKALALGTDGLTKLFNTMLNHTKGLLEYEPGKLDCEVLLFLAEDADWEFPLLETWAPFVEKIDARVAAGDHLSVIREPNVRVIATGIIEKLQKFGSSSTRS
ncbi:alpha/beta fold hydrolase, partial [Kitasatospora sp. NPDC057198]|uniref:thioesterase domain-containing protein n=1 Tax=Kitasatospora sp. NPDC057198 TaxID=3346046 RepID=UPI00363FA86F